MLSAHMIEMDIAKVIAAALSDSSLRSVEQENRDILRADLFKNMLLATNT